MIPQTESPLRPREQGIVPGPAENMNIRAWSPSTVLAPGEGKRVRRFRSLGGSVTLRNVLHVERLVRQRTDRERQLVDCNGGFVRGLGREEVCAAARGAATRDILSGRRSGLCEAIRRPH
jgi:hypothetical protein